MTKKNLFRILSIGCLLVLVAVTTGFAAGKRTGYGTLIALEDDGSVIIEGKGYLVSPSATVQDSQGKRISLKDLPLGSYVYFEYDYTKLGFMITLIKEVPQ
jgi:hypothetical protein